MGNKILLLLMLSMVLLSACAPSPQSSECDYADPARSYIAKSEDACSRVQFLCIPSKQPFYDACGCGCEDKTD